MASLEAEIRTKMTASSKAGDVTPAPKVLKIPAQVSFEVEGENHLIVHIDTERLHLESVKKKYLEEYQALFADPKVMEKFAEGKPRDRKVTESRVNTWIERFETNNPFSSLAVRLRDADEFLGQVVLGGGDKAGTSELAYLFKAKHWGKGLGTEAVGSVVQEYAPQVVDKGYKINNVPLESIVATARMDNPGSYKILDKLGMHRVGESEKFGAKRFEYSITMEEIQSRRKATI